MSKDFEPDSHSIDLILVRDEASAKAQREASENSPIVGVVKLQGFFGFPVHAINFETLAGRIEEEISEFRMSVGSTHHLLLNFEATQRVQTGSPISLAERMVHRQLAGLANIPLMEVDVRSLLS